MLIIFDLDDTLIETSKCLTPYYLKKALEAMERKGLKVENVEKAYEELLECNRTAVTASEALAKFILCKYGSSEDLILQEGIKALAGPLPKDVLLEPVPGALFLLHTLKEKHTLALVTRGERTFQLKKMKKAGVEQTQFSKLAFGRKINKKKEYIKFLKHFQISPGETIVCGDRVSLDLQPAKELGLVTVHLLNGRGAYCREPQECIDYTLERLDQFIQVLL